MEEIDDFICFRTAGRWLRWYANDRIVCGCWNDENGNTLESFKKRIESIYGEEGEKPNPLYYQEYRAAIAFFEAVRDLKGR